MTVSKIADTFASAATFLENNQWAQGFWVVPKDFSGDHYVGINKQETDIERIKAGELDPSLCKFCAEGALAVVDGRLFKSEFNDLCQYARSVLNKNLASYNDCALSKKQVVRALRRVALTARKAGV